MKKKQKICQCRWWVHSLTNVVSLLFSYLHRKKSYIQLLYVLNVTLFAWWDESQIWYIVIVNPTQKLMCCCWCCCSWWVHFFIHGKLKKCYVIFSNVYFISFILVWNWNNPVESQVAMVQTNSGLPLPKSPMESIQLLTLPMVKMSSVLQDWVLVLQMSV